MTDRLLECHHRYRFNNLQGLTPDDGVVGGRPILHAQNVSQNFKSTVYSGLETSESENDNDDFFDVAGGGSFSMWFKIRIIEATLNARFFGGDSSTSAPHMGYFSGEKLTFEVNGAGGRSASWTFSIPPSDGEVFVGAVSYDRSTNTILASHLKSKNGADISPSIDTSNSTLPGADGISFGGNAFGMSACSWHDAGFLIGEAAGQVDLDDTTEALFNEVDYDSFVGFYRSYSQTKPTYIKSHSKREFSSRKPTQLPKLTKALLSKRGVGLIPSFERLFSGSNAEGPISLINPFTFNRKYSSLSMKFYQEKDTFFLGKRKFSNFALKYTANQSDIFSSRRKYSSLPLLDFNELNFPPLLVNPIPDQVAFEDQLFDYIVSADTFDDPENDTITYSATLDDDSPLPSWLDFNPTIRRFLGTPLNEDVGNLAIKVTASDGFTPGSYDTFNLTVLNVNDPPVVDNLIPDQNIIENNDFQFQFDENVFSDEDVGDVLSYKATLSDDSALPEWLSFDGSTRTFSGVPPRSAIGVIEIKVLATDFVGASTSTTFFITVSAGFHEPLFPENISYGSSGGPGFNTSIIEVDSGAEQRVSRWTEAKRRYNVAYGVRSHEDLSKLAQFYITMQGAAGDFRFKDWLDYSSTQKHITIPGVCEPGPEDQYLGTGDGIIQQFQLIKTYKEGDITRVRNVTKPISGTLRVSIDGVEQKSGWSINTSTGVLTFTISPPIDSEITAGFEFHVFARFGKEVDQLLSQSVESFGHGSSVDIPVVEIRDDTSVNNEFFFGGAADLDISADTEISLAMGRVLRITSGDFANLEVILPPVSDLEAGGPYFYITNRGSNFLRIVPEQTAPIGFELANLQEDETIIVLLAVNGTTKEWIAI